MRRLAILGAGGHGISVAEAATLDGWNDVVFFDDEPEKRNMNNRFGEVTGDTSSLIGQLNSFDGAIVAIGNNAKRKLKFELLCQFKAPMVSVVHPFSFISETADIGAGSMVMAGAVINTNAIVGRSCIINCKTTVDHDSCLADFVHLSPGVCIPGNVSIGEETWVGLGAMIRDGLSVGKNVVIGAGSLVLRDVSDQKLIYGSPATEREIVRKTDAR